LPFPRREALSLAIIFQGIGFAFKMKHPKRNVDVQPAVPKDALLLSAWGHEPEELGHSTFFLCKIGGQRSS